MSAWDDFHYVIHGHDVHLIPQGDGSPLQWKNCAAATEAMNVMSELQGRRPPPPAHPAVWPPTGASFRLATGDKVDGLKVSQVQATARVLYGTTPDFQVAPAALVQARLRAGYGLSYMHRYGPIDDLDGLSGSPGFRDNHSAFVPALVEPGAGFGLEVISADPLYDGRRSSIPRGPQRIPWGAWQRAGELLVIGAHGERVIDRYGPGMLYVGFTRVPYRPDAPVAQVRYQLQFGTAEFWTYSVVGQVIKGARVPAQFSHATSAPCGPPGRYTWSGNTPRRLVRVSAGALVGRYVAVPQGAVKLVAREVAA